MVAVPRSLREFETWFPDDAACARWLRARRWPDGFRCPACGHGHGWQLGRGVVLIECAECHKQTSVTAGTVIHRSHLPLKTWLLAAWLVATHKNGISARQLWLQLGLGPDKTAWLLLAKLRRAMLDPSREALAGLVEVEVDETALPLRTINGAAVDPTAERRRLEACEGAARSQPSPAARRRAGRCSPARSRSTARARAERDWR